MKLPKSFITFSAISFLAGLFLFWPLEADSARKRTIKNVKREQQDVKKSIKENTIKLKENNRQTEANLKKLGELESELKIKNQQITDLRTSLDSLDSRIKIAGDSLSALSNNLATLKANYAKALRKMQGNYRDTHLLAFIFSSGSFREAAARYRYIKEFSTWRKRKLNEINNAALAVNQKKSRLGSLHNDRTSTLNTLAGNESQLRELRDQTGKVVSQLKKEGTALQNAIAKNEKRIKSLDKELDRLIVAEQQRQERIKKEQERKRAEQKAREAKQAKNSKNNSRQKTSQSKTQPKPNKEQSGIADADRVLSGSFEKNKGRLLFPVRGKFTIVRSFGRQRHPELPNVFTENTGIDIAVAQGTKARCIFEGTVSGVFSQDGYSKVIMVRHGNFISIYANLSSINVKTGDKVKANQDLGNIHTDQQYGNRNVLHFEIRKERAKLNPLEWVK